MKKVVELISTMNVGGAETMVKDYAMLMDQDKINMKIIALSGQYHSTNEQILKENGVDITFLGEMKYGERQNLNPFEKIVRFVSRYYYFRKLMMEFQPDILHVHLYMGRYLKVLPLKKLNMKLLFTVHNIPERFFSKKFGLNQKHREYKEAKRLIDKHGMTLIALHDSMNQELRELFKTDRVITVNNGIVLDHFDRSKYDRAAIRESLGVKQDEFLVGHVGRYHIQKNHEKIVEIFCALLKEKVEAKLLLIGRGELKEQIIELVNKCGIKDKVIFLENRQDIPELMCAMDVFLFPSKWEGFGNVLIEAQSMGLRCVISDCVPKSVQLTSLVYPVSLTADMSVWTEALLDADKKVTAKGKLSDYDMVNCVKKLQNIYLDM